MCVPRRETDAKAFSIDDANAERMTRPTRASTLKRDSRPYGEPPLPASVDVVVFVVGGVGVTPALSLLPEDAGASYMFVVNDTSA